MAYKLTNHERETIIIFNEAEPTATVTTYNGALIRKLDGLCSTRPDDVQLTYTDSLGGKAYVVPKSWIKVNASPIISDEKRKQRSENMRAIRKEQLYSNSALQSEVIN